MRFALLFFIFPFCLPSEMSAQGPGKITHSSNQTVLVSDLKKADVTLKQFIDGNSLIPEKYIKKNDEVSVKLLLDREAFFSLKEMIPSWGYISAEDTKAISQSQSMESILKETEILTREKMQYERLVSGADTTSGERFFDYWEKIISIDKEIAKLGMQMEALSKENEKYTFELTLKEEKSTGRFYGSAWINMPGLEYSYLLTEQPLNGETPKSMHGISLKYLFNWYKSYGLAGLYRNFDPMGANEVDETYIFAYGQDFYSRSLGRGQRKFFNLYSSFNLGLYISSSEAGRTSSWFVNPFLGLELYKTHHILADTKVGYFLPFKSNRNQRGLLCNFSFNFIL